MPIPDPGLAPALVTSYDQGLRWKTSPIGKEFEKILDDKGIRILTWVWQAGGIASHGRAIFLSDFLGPIGAVEEALARAADRGARGVLMQVLDPAEEEFPFDGRTIFESMGGTLRHETLRAGDLRDRYLARLAERKDRLAMLARAVGWHYHCHHTGTPAQSALLWLARALEGGR